MFAINPANWGSVKQAPDSIVGRAVTCDPGAEIVIGNLAQHKWGKKLPKFDIGGIEYHPPNVHPTADFGKSMAEDDMRAAIVHRGQALNGDMLDVTAAIAAQKKTNDDAYHAELGKDTLRETIHTENLRRKEASYRAKYAHMIREGFSEAEAGQALADIRREHAGYVARTHHASPETMHDVINRVIGRKV